MNVHWTESALADLQAVEAFLERRSPQYARGVVERIFARSESLAQRPRLGPMVPEYEDETLRELFEDPYRIIYRIVDPQIDIIAVIHAARRLPRGL